MNKKDRLRCSLVFDEFPTIFFNHMDGVIATARSNKIATSLAMQDISQLRKDYLFVYLMDARPRSRHLKNGFLC